MRIIFRKLHRPRDPSGVWPACANCNGPTRPPAGVFRRMKAKDASVKREKQSKGVLLSPKAFSTKHGKWQWLAGGNILGYCSLTILN